MKRFVSFVLSLVFLLSGLSTVAFATETAEEELTNVALTENAMAYTTSEKNTLWTPVKSIRDGKHNTDTWQGWECRYPEIIYGSDTSAGFSGEYCGIKFTKSEYYEISKININLGLHSALGGQNPHYLVQFLVEGVWTTVAEFNDSDTTPVSYSSYEEAMANDTSFYHIPSNISITLDEPLTTNNVRITVSEFGKNYPGGDVLIFPYIYEVELIGKRGVTPDIELPEGAVISANIAHHSFPKASSSRSFEYPYCAIDGDSKSYWSPKGKEAGEYLLVDLVESKKINKVVLDFGKDLNYMVVNDYKFNIYALVNDEWKLVGTGSSYDEENQSYVTEYSFDTVETTAVKLEFTEKYRTAPTVCEFETHLSDEKTYYVENRFTAQQRVSASKGNIAIIGKPYASLDFVPYSSVDYINDGKIDKEAYVWFSGVIDMPVYCGIKFNTKQLVNKVAVYVHTPNIEGEDIMGIEIQAMIDGDYKTIVKSKSYDKYMKYTTVYEFDAIETDDIRIKYTSGNGTFANMKELEIYSPNGIAPMFDGLEAMAEPPQIITGDGVDNILSSNPSSQPSSGTTIQRTEIPEFSMDNSDVAPTVAYDEAQRIYIITALLSVTLISVVGAFAVKRRKK
ncbi:MAG: discoidin domain-containing protein [Clostridia bacterium]|nr:discoidin domain-containing protein [Clostridia bacterium]